MISLVRIATRQSPLALWQAEYVKARLLAIHSGLEVQLVPMTTQGDRILGTPLTKIGGKGLFVKELEKAMLEGEADIAVHSMKDVPMSFPPGLVLAAICEREDPCDAFVSNHHDSLDSLPEGAIVGTSSLRRKSQLLICRPDLQIRDLRGNVGTRLKKLDQGDYDAIVLASAGLLRLDLKARIKSRISARQILPAAGQGAVGIEIRDQEPELAALLSPLNDATTWRRVSAERIVTTRLGGSCQVPIAAFAEVEAGQMTLNALVAEPDGSRVLSAGATGPADDFSAIGNQVAGDLASQGADTIIERLASAGAHE